MSIIYSNAHNINEIENHYQTKSIIKKRGGYYMSRGRVLVPEAKAGLNKFKMEAAKEVGVNLSEGYNGDLTSRENGSVGGQMVKRMVEAYEKNL
jgi:small acid-soluble spore protein D (minor alpha/beta-type SASP)